MHSPLSYHSQNNKKCQVDDSPLRSCDEIPTFEEAFDTFSLRKFFQGHESTNSQSAYSPHKENSIPGDFTALSLDDPDFLFSPLQDANLKLTPSISFIEVQVNPNSSPRAHEVYQASSPQSPKTRPSNVFETSFKAVKSPLAAKQTKNIQIIIHGASVLLKQDERATLDTQSSSFIDYSTFTGQEGPLLNPEEFNNDLNFAYKEDQISSFHRLLKSKKIFKLERTAPRIPLKLKRQASSSRTFKGTTLVPLKIRSTKSHPNLIQENNNINMFSQFNSATYPAVTFPQNSLNCLQTLDENNNFVNYIIPPLKYNGQLIPTGKVFNISNN